MTNLRQAAEMALGYIHERLIAHDQAYGDHPAMKRQRDEIARDLETLRQALDQLPDTTKMIDTGVTLRDYIATKAMQGFAVSDDEWGSVDHMAKGAYEWADAMLKARGE